MLVYMVRYNNITRRLGAKDNDIKYFKHLLPLDPAIVVEPFGGSFAVIKHFYKDTDKYIFHINDTDETLYHVYLHYQYFIDEYNKLCITYRTEFGDKPYKFLEYVIGLDRIHPNLKAYILKSVFIRGKMFKAVKTTNYDPIEMNILDVAILSDFDYTEIFRLYKNNEDAFLFLDPPYLFSDNNNYASQVRETDMTQIIVDIVKFIKTCKCKVMLIINKLNILQELFKKYIKGEYLKIYQIGKHKSYHLIITNYDI